MYFVAVDDQRGTYFLDPHKTQDALQFDHIDDISVDDLSSYHYTLEPKKTTIDQIDPSLLLGFYCRLDIEGKERNMNKSTKDRT
jgi:cysteine protease ATG4